MRADPIGQQIKIFMDKLYDQKEKEMKELGYSLIASPKSAQFMGRRISEKKISMATSQ